MNRLVFAILFVLTMVSGVNANPFLVSDPSADTAVDSCEIDGIALPCTLDSVKAIKIDLQSLPVGTYTVKARFCAEGGLWCSVDSSPFVFARPTTPIRPVNIKLGK